LRGVTHLGIFAEIADEDDFVHAFRHGKASGFRLRKGNYIRTAMGVFHRNSLWRRVGADQFGNPGGHMAVTGDADKMRVT
jgi:hypothetical protein